MKVRELMTPRVIRIAPEENAAVAARTLTHYNVGALPVCTPDGRLCGMLTDRDIVTRCLASIVSKHTEARHSHHGQVTRTNQHNAPFLRSKY